MLQRLLGSKPEEPDSQRRMREADLLAQLHAAYDREQARLAEIARLECETGRLQRENEVLRISQKDSVIEELADRLLESKERRERPVALPCSVHRRAKIAFAHQADSQETAG